MAGERTDDQGPERCPRCLALEAEVARLSSELARLRAKNEELLRSAAVRDFERPPHYQ